MEREPEETQEEEAEVSYLIVNEELLKIFAFLRVLLNPIALRMAKTLWSFGYSECNKVNFERGWCFQQQTFGFFTFTYRVAYIISCQFFMTLSSEKTHVI